MSTFLEGAATADAKKNSPITRLPTVMTRKEPKLKPPPPPPPPPVPDAETTTDGADGAGGEAGEGIAGKLEEMTPEQLQELRLRQAEREAARRKVMDEEVTEGEMFQRAGGEVEERSFKPCLIETKKKIGDSFLREPLERNQSIGFVS